MTIRLDIKKPYILYLTIFLITITVFEKIASNIKKLKYLVGFDFILTFWLLILLINTAQTYTILNAKFASKVDSLVSACRRFITYDTPMFCHMSLPDWNYAAKVINWEMFNLRPPKMLIHKSSYRVPNFKKPLIRLFLL